MPHASTSVPGFPTIRQTTPGNRARRLPCDAGIVERIEPAGHRAGSAPHVHATTQFLKVDDDGDADVVETGTLVPARRLRRRRRNRHGDAECDERQRSGEPTNHPKEPLTSATR